MLAILGQYVIRLAAAAEMGGRLLHAVVLAAAVADGARVDGCGKTKEGREHH